MTYVTLAQFEDWSEHVAGAKIAADARPSVTRMLAAAQTVVDEHCRRSWIDPDTAEASTRTFWPTSATGSRLLVGVASDATAVAVDGEALDSTRWRLLPTGSGPGAVLMRINGRWQPPAAVTLTATYNAGDVPDAVEEAVCRIAKRWLQSGKAQGADAILGLGPNDSITVARSWRDPDVLQLLERHVIDYGR